MCLAGVNIPCWLLINAASPERNSNAKEIWIWKKYWYERNSNVKEIRIWKKYGNERNRNVKEIRMWKKYGNERNKNVKEKVINLLCPWHGSKLSVGHRPSESQWINCWLHSNPKPLSAWVSSLNLPLLNISTGNDGYVIKWMYFLTHNL